MAPIRIAMWSGPRNISTAMMRSFENRPDTIVSDEPFYAAYLLASGIDHPMRAESIASQPTDWRDVVRDITGPVPGNVPIWYQKHMSHHMPPRLRHGMGERFPQRLPHPRPRALCSPTYTRKRAEVSLADIGFVQQRELFEREADRLGRAPP